MRSKEEESGGGGVFLGDLLHMRRGQQAAAMAMRREVCKWAELSSLDIMFFRAER
jgi:hypothetical protein